MMTTVTEHRRHRNRRNQTLRKTASAEQLPTEKTGGAGACRWYQTTFAYGLASGLLLWVAFPPLGWWPLAWIAPVFWLRLIQVERLPGRRPYRGLYLAAFVYWLAQFYFIVLPHWAGWFGWVALNLYLAVYVPLFVALSRVAVHRLRVPLLVAAPIVWVGLEFLRGTLFTGFAMAYVGHTQVSWTAVIQIADLFGAYAVSFAVLLAAACVAMLIPLGRRRVAVWPAIPLVGLFVAMLLYGKMRLAEEPPRSSARPPLRVALIQGSIDTEFDLTREEYIAREERSFDQYRDLTIRARQKHPDLDLIIWPEGKFPARDYIYRADAWEPPADDLETRREYREHAAQVRRLAFAVNGLDAATDESLGVSMLVGTTSWTTHEQLPQRFNTTLLLDSAGKVQGRYFKMHRVPFGEYIPLGEVFPFVYKLTPIPFALTPGTRPRVFEVGGLRLAPNICFESIVPHVIRGQLAELADEGTPADVMVNITDDGWFKGSNCLDLHLACTVFRAVENRTPTLVAANTGFSACIDGNGRVLKKGPRREPGVLFCEVTADGRDSLYRRLGDFPALGCLVLCGVLCCVGIGGRLLARRRKS